MMLSLFTLNNPMVAPYMVIASTMVISTVLSYIVLRLSFKKITLAKAPQAMKDENSSLKEELDICYKKINELTDIKHRYHVREVEASIYLDRAAEALNKNRGI